MLMLLEVLRSAFVFLAISTGLACPIVERLGLTPAERVVALPALSLLGVFLFAWAIYVFALPAAVFGLLPLLAAAGLLSGWRTLVGTWRDAAARSLVVSQLLVTGWCIAWMTTIASYSGGGWAGDWFEHWERTRFFLERWPLDRKFLLDYSLTARPPLVNVVVGAFLQLTRADFAHFQMGMTLFSSLAFLPAGLFALHWGGRRSIAVLALLFLVNPLFVENATFAWTKLPAGFFVLAALYFFLRSRGVGVPSGASLLGSALLGAGLLTHYSAGPYAVMLAAAWLGTAWARRRDLAWWRTTAGICLVGGLVLAVWFGWAVAHYGFAGTFFTNTSVTVPEAHGGVEPM
ncbi:MAG TPA: hypothetical protein VG710_09805, partial [Opitutus sp.]|nr:hypothetical protein [Opitutus sp.]